VSLKFAQGIAPLLWNVLRLSRLVVKIDHYLGTDALHLACIDIDELLHEAETLVID
jgi:hypothetical protein